MAEQEQENNSEINLKLSFPDDLIDTPYVEQVIQKSIDYIKAGVFIHFQGAANTGKTTFARYIACLLQQPVVSLHSNIHDNDTIQQIQHAVQQGHTLIFDECQRASFSSWQILLPLIEENLLSFPLNDLDGSPSHTMHPRFTAIFISNTDEASLWSIPSQLLDNYSVKIPLNSFDSTTAIAIIQTKASITAHTAQAITHLLDQLHNNVNYTERISVKLGIMLGRVLAMSTISIPEKNIEFKQACEDILCFEAKPESNEIVKQAIDHTIEQFSKINEETNASDDLLSVVSIMLHSEVEMEMQFFDEIISFMQEISDDEAEISFSHPPEAVQPDILITISQTFLPQIIAFIEERITGKVKLIEDKTTGNNECDILIEIPANVPDEAQERIDKLKKLIANYEKHHS